MYQGESSQAGGSHGGDHQSADQRPNLRPATKADLDRFETFRPTTEATAADLDGQLIGVGGFAYIGGRVFLFFEILPNGRRLKVTMHKMALVYLKKARERGFKYLYAEASTKEATAERWLTRLGFERLGEGSRLYRWQNSQY